MAKIKKPFSFQYNVSKKTVRNLTIVSEHIPLTITGTGYMNPGYSVADPFNRYDADIDFVIYEGKDVKQLLDFTGVLEDIEEAAHKEVARMFNETVEEAA
jgi:hypothetical protein